MTERYAAVLAVDRSSEATPPGTDPEAFRLALLEDTYEVAAEMGQVTAALALCPPDQPAAEAVTWPGTPVLRLPMPVGDPVPAVPTVHAPSATASAQVALAALSALEQRGADEGAVLAGDAPDLPVMLLGKLFQGLEHADVAICPAEGGGLVALAARLPVIDWFRAANVALDTSDALPRCRSAAPSRRALSVSPGWRRLRRPEDVTRLDPGLEGWDATRALLSGHSLG